MRIALRGLAIAAGAAGLAIGAGALALAQPPQDPIGAALSSAAPAPEPVPAQPPAAEPAKLRPAARSSDDAPPPSGGPAKAAAAARPADPAKRPRYQVAIIQALDKVTAETVRFEAPVGKSIRYKTLIFTVQACETSAADEDNQDAMVHVEIDSQPNGPDGKPMPTARQVFKGWMFASAPGLNLLQHPVYDAWLIACKTPAPSA
jgi:hypothetical protein